MLLGASPSTLAFAAATGAAAGCVAVSEASPTKPPLSPLVLCNLLGCRSAFFFNLLFCRSIGGEISLSAPESSSLCESRGDDRPGLTMASRQGSARRRYRVLGTAFG